MINNTSEIVTTIIPCRNEEHFISECLDSVIAQDYPLDQIDVIVADGMSSDGTREIVRAYAEKYSFIRMLDNPKLTTPVALNLGIRAAKGDYIQILGSHTKITPQFIRKNVEAMRVGNSDSVGGVLVTIPAGKGLLAGTVAIALSHPFGVGDAYFRIGSKEPKYVDTVPFGCYRREVFEKVGFFDEDLVRNQDDEFNLRLMKSGGKVLLVPDIVSYYYARDSLSKLSKMYYQYGYFKPLAVRKIGAIMTWRQLVPAFFVAGVIASGLFALVATPFLWLFLFILLNYFVVNIGFSFVLAIKKGLKYFLTLPVVFATLHLSYGIGYLKGILDFILLKKDKKRKIGDVPLTR